LRAGIVGDPLALEARQGRSQDVPQVSEQHPDVLQAPDYQRRQRSFELLYSNH